MSGRWMHATNGRTHYFSSDKNAGEVSVCGCMPITRAMYAVQRWSSEHEWTCATCVRHVKQMEKRDRAMAKESAAADQRPTKSPHEMLKSAVRDLLCELRIDPQALEVMARGYSPDHPSVRADMVPADPNCQRRYCKVQLSQVVARQLLAAKLTDA